MKAPAPRNAILAIVLPFLATACVQHTNRNTDAATGDNAVASGAEAQARSVRFAEAMRAHGIPGAQLAYCRLGACETHIYGVMSNESKAPVTEQTIFQAASLSKVVGAYIALRLVDQGKLDLDAPLWSYWQSPRTNADEQARKITARMVLNHTTGLPNWQISPSDPAIDRTPLTSEFPAGARFQYSGEGFYLLQKTIEHITGTGWNALAEREVFSRFDMPSSSYLTDPAFDAVNAFGHEKDGTTRRARVFSWENTAWTLVTNAHDYGNFIQKALYRGEGLAPATHRMMFAESSDADDRSAPTPADAFVSWGLGVGLQTTPGRKLVWHWGDNPGFKAFFMLDPATGDSMILFTNSENGPSAYREMLETFLGKGEYPALDWVSAQG